MDLKEIFKFIKKSGKFVTIGGILGLVVGMTLNFIPPLHTYEGYFITLRKSEAETKRYFAYEGYYAQQTASNYSNNAAAILESKELLREALIQLEIDPNPTNLTKYYKKIDVKKPGSQLILLRVKDSNKFAAESLWTALADNLGDKHKNLSQEADPSLYLQRLTDTPVYYTSYRSIWVYGFVGLIVGKLIGLFALLLKNYTK